MTLVSPAPQSADLPASRLETLRRQRESLLAADPRLRARDVAEKLGISEAELLLVDPANRVTLLAGEWLEMVGDLATLGPVMALTRNEEAVIEKVGTYGKPSGSHKAAVIINGTIDLRLFTSRWHLAAAVEVGEGDATRRSIQFFDQHGVAMHKVHAKPETDLAAFAAYVARWKAPVQPHELTLEPAPVSERPADIDLDVPAFREAWLGMRDVHEFFGIIKKFGVPREQALREVGPDLCQPVPVSTFREALNHAATTGLSIMIFVGSPGCIEIHTGPISRVEIMGPWLNILDPGFNLHLREDLIASAYALRRPTAETWLHSIELYNANGEHVLIMLGERKAHDPELPEWTALVEKLAGFAPLPEGVR